MFLPLILLLRKKEKKYIRQEIQTHKKSGHSNLKISVHISAACKHLGHQHIEELPPAVSVSYNLINKGPGLQMQCQAHRCSFIKGSHVT